MARETGLFSVPANYEPHITAPFDARELVSAKADLYLESTWKLPDGSIWIYSGMTVSTANGEGKYMLIDASNYQNEAAWIKFADSADLKALQEKIDTIWDDVAVISGGGANG